MSMTPDSGTPPEGSWWGTDDGYAHVFRVGERLSACRAWWAGRRIEDATGYARCPECAEQLTEGAPGEITEAFGK